MVQCEKCSEWYQYPCTLGDIHLPENRNDHKITFVYGLDSCLTQECCFFIQSDGKYILFVFRPDVHIYDIIQAEQTDQKSDHLLSSVDKSVENKEGPSCSDHSCAEETDQGTDIFISDHIWLNSVPSSD